MARATTQSCASGPGGRRRSAGRGRHGGRTFTVVAVIGGALAGALGVPPGDAARAVASPGDPALTSVMPFGGAAATAAPRLVPISAGVARVAAADPPLVRIDPTRVPAATSLPGGPRGLAAPVALRSLPIEPATSPSVAFRAPPLALRSLPVEPVVAAPVAPPPGPVALRSLPVADTPAPRTPLAAVSLAPPEPPRVIEPPRPLAPLPMAQSEHAAPVRLPPAADSIASLPPPAVRSLPPLPAPIESPRLTPPPLAPAAIPMPGTPSPAAVLAAPAAVAATHPLTPPPLPAQAALQPAALQPAPPAAPEQLAGPAAVRAADPAGVPPQPRAAGGPGKPADAIVIGSFNIQVFGESKLAKQPVVDVLARVVRGFDVVAIQEVRAKSDTVIPQFVAAVNADGSRYQYVVGPRLGRTSSKEQYAFIYDSTRIEIDPGSVGTMPEPADRLHRPPLHARFRVRANPPENGFSFWLVDTHTDPDEVKQEVDALADVFVAMRSLRPDEDDVILLGDFNASPAQFGKIKNIPGIGWAVSNATTNTRRTKTYDNLVFVPAATAEYTGRWGVLDLQDTFGLPLEKALEVSDHNPVWAAFRPWEAPRVPLAAQPPAVVNAQPVR